MAMWRKVPMRLSAPICSVFMLELTGFGDDGRLSEMGRCDWPVLITLRLIPPPPPPARRRRRFSQRTDEQTRGAWQQRLQETSRNKDGCFYIAAGRTDKSHELKFSCRNRQPEPLRKQPRVPTANASARRSSWRLNRRAARPTRAN